MMEQATEDDGEQENDKKVKLLKILIQKNILVLISYITDRQKIENRKSQFR